ncbi:hypothetical protein AbraIFM66950_005778 [Aspergillus brasiliensis]|nr:hypothetical protein AbraIFM66950_005778 [Aspergillus brasiliensis]
MEKSPAVTYLELDNDRIDQLMRAAHRGQLREVQSLLYGVSPNVQDQTGRTAFSWAASYDLSRAQCLEARNRFNDLLQYLLDRGANPNIEDHHGETPLHWAVKGGDPDMVDLLLQKGVASDIADARGRTPLSRAAGQGHCRIVQALLSSGRADPDSKDSRGRTPLSWAAENWHLDTVRALVAHGASADIHDHEGQIPLWWVISNHNKRREANGQHSEDFQQWLAVLGPTQGVEPMTKARRTFLAWASERGDTALVHELLKTTWADPNCIDRYRKTPLVYALEWSHYEIADMLMSGSDDANRKHDVVSLKLMVQESRARLLKPFLERYKPDLSNEDESSPIPLMRWALQQADRSTVAILLEHKAGVDGLENGDWFGPCSTEKASTNLMINQNVRNDGSSIPVMDMTISDGDRAAFTALLTHRRHMMALDDGYDGRYSRGLKSSVAVDIVVFRDGRRAARWISDDTLYQDIKAMPKTAEETHLLLFRENHYWNTYCQLTDTPNELQYSLGNKSPCRTFSLFIRLDMKIGTFTDTEDDDRRVRIIEWAVLEAPQKAIHYFSNLPYGWIPESDLELVQLFMQTWRDDWIAFCREARGYLGRLRTHQLTARGKDDRLIDSIAESMQQWTQIQAALAEQLGQARNFVTQYQRFSETRKFSERMQSMIDGLDKEISGQIDKLEQTVRDLLQIEFAWVSINEAHRSTSLATSMKRLSWITFIFLPLTFASSLFGMNVDILSDNPSWRWYPLIGGVLVLLTVAVWLSTKFTNVERWVETQAEEIINGRRKKETLVW